jgi:outer membrane protein
MNYSLHRFKSTPSLRKPVLAAIAVACASLVHWPAWAVVDAPVREAIDAVNAKQAQKAFDLLSPLEATRAGDPDFDSALGIAANEVGQFARAIFALERVLAVQPGNARARAELARALFAVGDSANARRLLEETKSEGVPETVGRTIDEFLQAIDKVDEAGRSTIKAHVEMGLGHDSNVNSGPSSNSFAVPFLGGAIVTLNPAGIKTSASYTHLGAGVSGRAVLAPRWSFLGSASGSLRRHSSKGDPYDVDQYDLSGGAAYRDERHEFSGVLNLGHTAIGGSTLRKLTGMTGEWTYRPDGTRQWGTYLQLATLDYPSQPVRDAKRTVLGTSYAMQAKSGALYYGGGYYGTERTDDSTVSHLGYRMLGLRAGMQMPVHAKWSLFATASFERRNYQGPDLLFSQPATPTTPFIPLYRQDSQFDLSLGAMWRLTDYWRITPQLNFNKNKSNTAVNDSSKQTFSVTARYEF